MTLYLSFTALFGARSLRLLRRHLRYAVVTPANDNSHGGWAA